MPSLNFSCHLYIPAQGYMKFALPAESGPRKIVRLSAPSYDQLTDPGFRRLLATFESLQPPPLKIVQV